MVDILNHFVAVFFVIYGPLLRNYINFMHLLFLHFVAFVTMSKYYNHTIID